MGLPMHDEPMASNLPKRLRELLRPPDASPFMLADDGPYPNNTVYPALIYRRVITASVSALIFEQLFEANGWHGTWRNGVYGFHHYHSTAHEVLGVVSGRAGVQLGGDNGIVADLSAGDVVLIPAGVAHKNLGSSTDFAVVGAYPVGQQWDMNFGKPGERPRVDENIASVPKPETDPVYGPTGPLAKLWNP
jgi:uncharacterized protein YjlB